MKIANSATLSLKSFEARSLPKLPTDASITLTHDPTYHPPDTPRSRRELQTTRNETAVTRSREKIVSQKYIFYSI